MASSTSPSPLFMVQKQNPQSNHLAVVTAAGKDLCKPKTEVTGLNSQQCVHRLLHLPLLQEVCKEETKKKNHLFVTGLNSLSSTSCIYHCCKRCARKRQRRKYLPQEIFSKVLLLLPAQVLHDAMRHVCRDWNLVIRSQNFIYDHLRNSNSGLIIQGCLTLRKTFVEMRQGCLEISKFDFGFEDLVTSSCNGLVLAIDVSNLHILYVVNPVTKMRLALPPFFKPLYFTDFCGFAFVVPSMEYKVVTSYGYRFNTYIQCAVLTIGVDQVWRHIDIQHLSLTTRKALLSHPLTTGGFVHWINKAFVLTLNMETETIHRFSRPPVGLIYGKFLPMENNLTYVCKVNDFLWEVWEMSLETGVWNKLFSFDLGAQIYRYKDFFWPADEVSSLWLVST